MDVFSPTISRKNGHLKSGRFCFASATPVRGRHFSGKRLNITLAKLLTVIGSHGAAQ